MRWLVLPIVCLLSLASCASNRAGEWSPHTSATSVEGRPIRVWNRSGPEANPADAPRVLIIGGIHGDEPEALGAIDALRRSLAVSREACIRVIDDANPDGSAHRTRGNAHGVDLNRNWPARSFASAKRHGATPLSEPESRFLHDQINEFAPTLIIVCHSARNGPYVNFDGPAEVFAAAFAAAAKVDDPRWHVRASMGYATPGSLGTWAGVERQIPILTVEFARGHDAPRAERALTRGTVAAIDALVAR